MLNKRIIYIVVLLAVAGGGGYYAYNEFYSTSLQKEYQTKTTQVGDYVIEADGDFEIEMVSPEEFSSVVSPDLDKKIVFYNETSEGEKIVIIKKIEDLTEALKLNKSSSELWLDLASYRKSIGDYKEASNIWEYMTKVWSKDTTPLYNLGDLNHYYLKDFAKSEEYFLKAIENDPRFISAYRALHDLYRMSFTEKTHLADDILLQGLDTNLNHVDLLIPLAIYYKETGDIKKAMEYYQKALKEAKNLKNAPLIESLEQEINTLK